MGLMVLVAVVWFFPPAAPPVSVKAAQVARAEKPSEQDLVDLTAAYEHPNSDCNLEFMNDRAFGERLMANEAGDGIHLRGWAIGRQHGQLPTAVYVRFVSADGRHRIFRAFSGFDRPDVVQALQLDPRLSRSGFQLELAPGVLPAGRHTISLVLLFATQTGNCYNGRQLEQG